MPCCKILIILITLLLLFSAIVFSFLYYNNFRIMYFDLRMLFPGKKKPEAVGKYYDDWLDRYQEVYGNTIQSYRSENIELLHQYIIKSAGLKDGMNILDAGCGVGGPAIYFAKQLDIHIDAITVSEKQAQEAQKNVNDCGLQDKISIITGDYHLIDKMYPENYFDEVIFLESYGHAQNHEKLLKAASKVLKTGGCIYIKDYFKKDLPKDLLQKQLIKMGIRNMDTVYHYNTPDLYQTIYIMRQLNFELHWLRIPELPEWDNNKVIQDFHIKNNIAFYNGKDALYNQNNGRFIVDPYEMTFFKNGTI